jgi:hypothetical protein
LVQWYKSNANDDHRQGQSEIYLDESHAIEVSLSGCGHESDSACLRSHDAQTDRPPLCIFFTFKISVTGSDVSGFPISVTNNKCQRGNQYSPVNPGQLSDFIVYHKPIKNQDI